MRCGPLTATTSGVAVAAVEGLHLLLTPDGLVHRRGSTPLADTVPWEETSRIELGLRVSRLPFPGALATVGYALLALVSQQVDDVRHGESTIVVAGTDGTRRDLPVNHAVGGYGRRAVALAGVLLDRLVAEPAQRGQLAEPERVVQGYADAVRRRRASA
ncbi:hypothetical protein [Microbacterium sp. SORGH_AS_0888]|uniref:hypothetical protein n=1 Tax=Microbacterium sp. SORGH_AS_0888 TaxID=3041791 RepID=UPI0027856A9F|nr:hypothetical protein [Microbacterium sp. SORGH_AS_0888]MDQ1130595.1 hypothetical protein [Microbacterium sp. SORGH_AS_0888]